MGTFWVRLDAEGDTPPLDMGRGDGHPNYYCLHSYSGGLFLGVDLYRTNLASN